MIQNKLFLFDIDGTLLKLNGAGIKSLAFSFSKVFDRDISLEGIHFYGKTDLLIWKAVCSMNNIEWQDFEKNLNVIKDVYLEKLNSLLSGSKCGRQVDNAEYIIKYLKKKYHIGLLTGNIKDGALTKLKHFGLDVYFDFGAFGDDSENRNDLIKFAVDRFETLTNKKIDNKDIHVIGDTPLDIECAEKNNVKSIAAATGIYTYTDLRKYNPDYLINNLIEIETYF